MSRSKSTLPEGNLHDHLAAIIESSDDGIISEDLHGVIHTWNRGAQRLFGYTPEEAIGRHISMLASPDRKDESPKLLQRIMNGERIDRYETKRQAKDGRVITISLSVSPVRNEAGVLIGAIKTARDLTPEKRISEVRDHMAAIVESSDDGIISKDLNGIIRSWNRGAQRIFGYSPEEAIGKHISMLAVPERIEEIPNIIDKIALGERVEHYQTLRRAKDGRLLSISLTVSPIRDAWGKIIGASKIARDITEQVRRQAELMTANRMLTQANADLEQFAYSASHDLQEPLRMVCAYSDMLRKKFSNTLGPRGEEYLGHVVNGALRMDQLLRDLRAFSQACTVDRDARHEADAEAAIRGALQNLAAAIEMNQAAVTFGTLPTLQIHQFQLQQVFQNLIGNAIRYRSTEPPKIDVTAERYGAEWKISVSDNGIGIAPEYKEQIFGLFKRLHTTNEYPGTGMGLAICQRAIERSGGRIWVQSELGRGSTFFFTLPSSGPSW